MLRQILLRWNPDSIEVLGVVGEDWRADALLKAMQNLGINTNNINRKFENSYKCLLQAYTKGHISGWYMKIRELILQIIRIYQKS